MGGLYQTTVDMFDGGLRVAVYQVIRVILIGELFSRNFDIFFAQFFNLQFFLDFFPKYSM